MTDYILTGPSLSMNDAQALHPEAVVFPPAGRGDLYSICKGEEEARRILVIDGLFSVGAAPSPSEFVAAAAQKNTSVFGAASMGALRAIECAPAGVTGLGVVHRLYRLGLIKTDGEVAIGVDRDDDFRATTTALVDIRWYLSRARRRRELTQAQHDGVLDSASAWHFLERTPLALRACGQKHDLPDGFWAPLLRRGGIKRRDAVSAVRLLANTSVVVEGDPPRASGLLPRPLRFDSAAVFPPEPESAMPFGRWLFASGEYQQFFWPIVLVHAANAGFAPVGVKDPEAAREFAARVMGSLLQRDDDYIDTLVSNDLAYLGELTKVKMLWSGMHRLASLVTDPDARVLRFSRNEIAVKHGFDDYLDLIQNCSDTMVHDAIPLRDVDDASRLRAKAFTATDGIRPRVLGLAQRSAALD